MKPVLYIKTSVSIFTNKHSIGHLVLFTIDTSCDASIAVYILSSHGLSLGTRGTVAVAEDGVGGAGAEEGTIKAGPHFSTCASV